MTKNICIYRDVTAITKAYLEIPTKRGEKMETNLLYLIKIKGKRETFLSLFSLDENPNNMIILFTLN